MEKTLVPLYATMHGRESHLITTSWCPDPIRLCSGKLEERIQRRLQVLKFAQQRQSRLLPPHDDISLPIKVGERGTEQALTSNPTEVCNAATKASLTAQRLEPIHTHDLVQTQTNALDKLPTELFDQIIDCADIAGSISRALDECESGKIHLPGLIMASKTLQHRSLRRAELTIRAKCWPMEPPRELHGTMLLRVLLQTVTRVRIDCSGLTFTQLTRAHPVMAQFAEIWRATNELAIVTVFVPPHYESLPEVFTWDPEIKRFLQPLLGAKHLEDKLKVSARDFAGEIKPNCNALFHAVCDRDESLVDFILQASQATVNSWGPCRATPLMMAVNNGNTNIVRRLLAIKSLNVNQVGTLGGTAVELAIMSGNKEIWDLLFQTGQVDVESEEIRDLLLSATWTSGA